MKAIWNGQVIAESDDTIIVDNNHYFPEDSLNMAYFKNSQHTTVCGWKGTASYYSVIVDGKTNNDSAWYYASPKNEAESIRGWVAFWRGIEIIR